MARAYSDDLRRKFLEAHDAGEGTLVELAEQFHVSVGYAYKISAQRKRTGQMERQPHQPGRKQSLDRKLLAEVADAQPDATLVELQERIEQRSGVGFTPSGVWRALRQMGYRLKKSRSTPSSATPRRIVGAVRSSWPNSAPRRRKS
jgi:transposase